MNKSKQKKKSNGNFRNKRNSFLATGLAAVLCASAGMFYFHKISQKQNEYKATETAEDIDEEAYKKSLIFLDGIQEVNLPLAVELDFKRYLMNTCGVNLEDIVINRATEQAWVKPYCSTEDFSQTQDELMSYVDDLFNFINNSKIIKPKIELVIPKKGDRVIDFAESDVFKVYALEALGAKLTVHYTLNVNGQTTSENSSKLFERVGFTFDAYVHKLDPKTKELVYLEQKKGNIFCARKNSLNKIDAVPTECLHRAFSSLSDANLRKKAKEYYENNQSSEDIIPSLINQQNKIEEGLVHAIAYLWLKQNLDKYSAIKIKDLEDLRELYKKQERYQMVESCLDVIQKNGLERTIEMYAMGELSVDSE